MADLAIVVAFAATKIIVGSAFAYAGALKLRDVYGRTVETWSTYWSLMHESPSAQAWNGRVRLATSVRIGDHISS